jgi:UDP-N-acetylmuramoyl-tripeptide--D-alanyl-D-alanine ligase
MHWTGVAVEGALCLTTAPVTAPFTSISTDTRTIEPGALFVALSGERFDGHAYLAQARDQGACAAVVRRGTPPVSGLELLEVADPLAAYGDLARARRRMVTGPVVCVTGNNGKTTTKEMVAAVLRTRYRTHATRANNNNLVGVPLTILEAPDDVEALVIEGGGNVPGELPRYREIVAPDITIATNATEGHLEGYGTLQAIVEDTAAVARGVPVVIVGTEPPSLAETIRRGAHDARLTTRDARPAAITSVGFEDADRIPEIVSIDAAARSTVHMGGRTIQLPLPGRHQAVNALFAWVVAESLGLDLDRCAAALASVSVPAGRSELSEVSGYTVFNDCYNANPHSFAAAIATARELRRGRRLVFVAGTMRELGPDAAARHDEVADAILTLEPELVAAVGEFVPAFARHAVALGDRLVTAPDAATMGPLLARRLQGGELIVLKGSRGATLERILPAVTGRASALH